MDTSSTTTQASMEFLGMAKHHVRAATYARCSDTYEDEKTIASQTDVMKLYAEQCGYELNETHIYQEAITGYYKPFRERKEFTKLLEAGRRHEFDVLIVNEFSRLSRRQTEQAVIIDLLEHCKVKVESVTEKYEDLPIGYFMRNVYAFLSEIERDKILERLNRGKIKKAREGQMLGQGVAKYGYAWNTERTGYVANYTPIYTDEAEYIWSESVVVQFVFSQLKQRISMRKIALYLNELGVPTRKGGPWMHSMIRKIATDPQYTGDARAFRLVRENGRDVKRPLEEQIILPDGTIAPLVSKEDFAEVQQILKDNKSFSARNNGAPFTALMRSLCKCGICGYTMRVQRHLEYRTDRADDYHCHQKTGREGEEHCVSITVAQVDEKAWEVALKYISNPSLLDDAIQEFRKILQAENDTQEVIKNQLAENKRKFANLWTMAESCTDTDTLATLKARLKELEQEKKRLQQYQYTLEEEENFRAAVSAEVNRFALWADKVRPRLTDTNIELPYEEKRLAVLVLGIRARVLPLKSTGAKGEQPYRVKIEVAPPNILNLFSEHSLSIPL